MGRGLAPRPHFRSAPRGLTPVTNSPASEELTPERVRQIVREALAQRIVDDKTDHAKPQLARLAPAMQIAGMAVADADVKAIPAFLKVLDRLDRYQRAAKVNQVYDDEARKRPVDKINRVAANLGYDHARTAGESEDWEASAGNEAEKEKMPGGSAQAFEKARFGEGNPRISLAKISPGFAQFGSDLAQFGSIWIFLGSTLDGARTPRRAAGFAQNVQ
jgi:hypothetical protein